MRAIGWIVVSCLALPTAAAAQDSAFAFSLTTGAVTPAAPRVRMTFELGAGDASFHQQSANGLEQRVGLDAASGRLRFVGHVGIASTPGSYQMSQQGEVLVSLSAPAWSVGIAAGGGVLREAGGATVLLARVVAGRGGSRTRLDVNLLFQKPLAAARDGADLIASLGWTAQIVSALSAGIEAIGEDLEGFWDPAEAEGGARILIGPSVRIAPAHRQWQLVVAGGPMLHPKASSRQSTAIRDLPATPSAHGYAAKAQLSWHF